MYIFPIVVNKMAFNGKGQNINKLSSVTKRFHSLHIQISSVISKVASRLHLSASTVVYKMAFILWFMQS
jgi:hypothetical protein